MFQSKQGVGRYIASARRKAGLTQDELAVYLNVTRQTISNWENGKSQPDIQALKKLADIFSVPVEQLIYGQNMSKEKVDSISDMVLYDIARFLAWTIFLVGFWFGWNFLYYANGLVTVLCWSHSLGLGMALLGIAHILKRLESREEER